MSTMRPEPAATTMPLLINSAAALNIGARFNAAQIDGGTAASAQPAAATAAVMEQG